MVQGAVIQMFDGAIEHLPATTPGHPLTAFRAIFLLPVAVRPVYGKALGNPVSWPYAASSEWLKSGCAKVGKTNTHPIVNHRMGKTCPGAPAWKIRGAVA
ncbi:hypothetical protein DQ04_14151000 [Trypanosoma grayi]|uniref:hypothetical protein n=1 Tax=Trypanosoma grayi TaxID=71804 RepID=UPI0004F4AD46|nr:hypothetical protein DQ04_14151000 [Trypanosoma grayi]KEG06393.1 hypothetical protein DQ04_14151000 [Trypanosoma grayi]